jgi:hypothetical protein
MEFFEQIKNYGDIYLSLLKTHSQYSKEQSRWSNDINIVAQDFDNSFTEIVSQGKFRKTENELTQIFSVLRWVYETLLYDSQSECPKPLTARRILEHSRKNKVTVNCLSHAILLNECLIALGFNAKVIYCLPVDLFPSDNHVVVHVYCASLKKWIVVDPSWNCYYTDNANNYLSLPEIRKFIINGESVNIKYNHRNIQGATENRTKGLHSWGYLYPYMCKNLFRFTIDVRIDINTHICYELMPSSVVSEEKEVSEEFNGEILIRRFMNNQDNFWAVPK